MHANALKRPAETRPLDRAFQRACQFAGFSARLRRALRAAGYAASVATCRAMQRQVGISAHDALRLLSGSERPDRQISNDLADWLDVDRDWLYSGRQPTPRVGSGRLLRDASQDARRLADEILAAPPATRELLREVLKASRERRLPPPSAHFMRGFFTTLHRH